MAWKVEVLIQNKWQEFVGKFRFATLKEARAFQTKKDAWWLNVSTRIVKAK